MEDTNHKLFKEYYDTTNERILYNIEQRDKQINYIAVTLLVLSLGSVKYFNYRDSFTGLVIACLLFAVAVTMILISFYCGYRANKLSLIYAEEYYLNNKDEYRNKKNGWSDATAWCNNLAMLSCLIGLFFMVSILLFNINEEIKMSKIGTQDGAESAYMIQKAQVNKQQNKPVENSKKGAGPAPIPPKPPKTT